MSQQEQCCKLINPTDYDGREWTWQDRPFVQGHVVSFLHLPLNFGPVITFMTAEVARAGAADQEYLMLSDETSAWGSELFLPVTKPVESLRNVRLTGRFLTKVFEGPYKDAGKWHQEMVEWLKGRGREAQKIYYFYTACPKCAKKFGKNYVVLVAKVG